MNNIDLTNEKNSVREFSRRIFSQSDKTIRFTLSENQLSVDNTLIEKNMNTDDLFCLLVEIVLWGVSDKGINIFDLNDVANEVVSLIKKYMNSCGIIINLVEDVVEYDPCLYSDRKDYYCQILPMPPKHLCWEGWYIGEYKLITNKYIEFENDLSKYKAFFISDTGKIFVMSFGLVI